jgi:hypothetical protein
MKLRGKDQRPKELKRSRAGDCRGGGACSTLGISDHTECKAEGDATVTSIFSWLRYKWNEYLKRR